MNTATTYDKHAVKALADDEYPRVTIAAYPDLPEPNHAQKTALFRKWKQNDCGETWRDFAQSAAMSADGCVMVHWAGMWLGIERDGYTHS